MLLTLVAFGVMVGVLIFVHELGHFLAAKGLGVQVHRFSLGFGKSLVSVRRGETEYVIAAIPLGGYVKMAGLEDEAMEKLEGPAADPVDPARAFDRKPIWVRLVILSAGVTMNVLLAFVVFAGRAMTIGLPANASTTIDSVHTELLPAQASALASLRPGDQVIRINGDTIRNWGDLERQLQEGPSPARIEVAGGTAAVVVPIGELGSTTRDSVTVSLGPRVPPRLGVLIPGMPGYRAGLQPKDLVIRVNGDTVRWWSDVTKRIKSSPGKSMDIEVLRGTTTAHVTVVPELLVDSAGKSIQRYGQIGVYPDPPMVHIRESFTRSLGDAAENTAGGILQVLSVVKQLVLGHASLTKTLSGPLEIASVSGQAARLGFDWFLGILTSFSLTLAVLNFLPIPILDGGQVMFVLAEAVRRKPLSLNVRLRLSQVGFVLLMCLMLFAIVNGAFKFFGH